MGASGDGAAVVEGADKDAFDNLELGLAVCKGHMPVVLTLLAAGAETALRCGQAEKTVVIFAAETGADVEIVRALIEHGPGVDAVDILVQQHTVLHLFSRVEKPGRDH